MWNVLFLYSMKWSLAFLWLLTIICFAGILRNWLSDDGGRFRLDDLLIALLFTALLATATYECTSWMYRNQYLP